MANDCRLIDASAVLKYFDGYGFGQECDAEIILDYIAEDAPTVDAVEVPCRCKECRYSVQDQPYDPMECMKWKSKWGVAYTSPDGYCHKGERKSK